ncbi:hypothetical protein OAA60_00610 [Porticoccaceae bacterium]|nr:hypothetical protein [Porticoccaceae bacterium]
MASSNETAPEWLYGLVTGTDNSTTVYPGPCLVRGILVRAGMSAHTAVIKDGTTEVAVMPASLGGGSWMEMGDVRFDTSLVFDPDDSMSTGTFTVIYKPNHEGLVGSGA